MNKLTDPMLTNRDLHNRRLAATPLTIQDHVFDEALDILGRALTKV